MLFGMLLVSQAVSQALLDQADARNQAFVTCLFSVSREADSGGVSEEQFERKLGAACRSEEEYLRDVSIKILRLRGHSATEAAERTARLLSEARQSVAAAYRQSH